MFIRKKVVEELKYRITILEEKVYSLDRNGDIVTCETCGCAVMRRYAVKGPGEVKTRVEYSPHKYGDRRVESVEYIHHDYFCRAHAPEKKAGDQA